MKRSIVVLDPAVQTAETGCFNRLVFESPAPLTYHLPKLGTMRSIETLGHDPLGIVVLGSFASVNDGEPWQLEMNAWLKKQMDAGTPTLGICYGHQLISHLYGTRVTHLFPDQTKLVGMRKITLKAHSLWGAQCEGRVAVSHCEFVTACPDGFELLASNPQVPVEAIAHKKLPIWGFQSHPEATVHFLERRGIPKEEESALSFGHGLVRKFLEFAAKR